MHKIAKSISPCKKDADRRHKSRQSARTDACPPTFRGELRLWQIVDRIFTRVALRGKFLLKRGDASKERISERE